MSWELGLLLAILGIAAMFFKSTRGSFGTEISPTELLGQLRNPDPPLVLDVRSEQEFRSGHIPGAMNIEVQAVSAALPQLEPHRNRAMVVTCEHGVRARMAIRCLSEAGFVQVAHLKGDMAAWRHAGLELEQDR